MGARRRRRGCRGAALALVLGAAALTVLAGCAPVPSDALSRLAHLDAGAHPSDELDPPVVEGIDSDLLDSSLRLLDTDQGTEYWVGVTTDDRVCFIAEVTAVVTEPAGEPVATHVECVGAERFGRAGATLELTDPDRHVWLHTEYMTPGAGWTVLTPSLAMRS
ncbi:hypothetical protein N1031_01065 [Herbiconiux moechotypicola]|uniref:Lipoprotein n=1 Tax=Herbiconiux moechotypicola TaxID=637393 RepID=A0ABP5Q216_9MICO|nr:hypothetical protein [Herbiconiux moechotypicola]MCS5728343.1 hypothetical protein [Herbiconiux moechotypicola]